MMANQGESRHQQCSFSIAAPKDLQGKFESTGGPSLWQKGKEHHTSLNSPLYLSELEGTEEAIAGL